MQIIISYIFRILTVCFYENTQTFVWACRFKCTHIFSNLNTYLPIVMYIFHCNLVIWFISRQRLLYINIDDSCEKMTRHTSTWHYRDNVQSLIYRCYYYYYFFALFVQIQFVRVQNVRKYFFLDRIAWPLSRFK